MTKYLKRLNIKPRYSTRPMPSSGHRCLTERHGKKWSYYIVTVKQRGQRQFKCKKDALCYKFIMILKIKSKYYTNGRNTSSNLPCKRST